MTIYVVTEDVPGEQGPVIAAFDSPERADSAVAVMMQQSRLSGHWGLYYSIIPVKVGNIPTALHGCSR